MWIPLISTDTLRRMSKEARTREGAHALRTYDLALTPSGVELRVCDRSKHYTYNVTQILEFDALAVGGMFYARSVFDSVDDKVAVGLDSLDKFGGREDV